MGLAHKSRVETIEAVLDMCVHVCMFPRISTCKYMPACDSALCPSLAEILTVPTTSTPACRTASTTIATTTIVGRRDVATLPHSPAIVKADKGSPTPQVFKPHLVIDVAVL